METFLNKILIIDGSYQLHRCLHTPELSELMTESGLTSGGIFGFLRILNSEIKKYPGYYPVVCWDAGQSSRRLALYPNYKHHADHQEAPPIPGSNDDLYLKKYHDQRGALIEILKSMGIPSLKISGFEGDDLMFVLTRCSAESIILSDDKDMIQLVDKNVKVARPMNKELIDFDSADAYYKHPRYIIRKAIVGDGSDNIPHVAEKVGEKTADQIAEILQDFYATNDYSNLKNGLNKIIKDGIKISSKTEKVLENYKQFEINMNLMDLRKVEIPHDIEYIVNTSIRPVVGKANFLEASSWLGKYQITKVDLNRIIGNLIPYANDVIIKRS
jgi:5'-3' exonuclease